MPDLLEDAMLYQMAQGDRCVLAQLRQNHLQRHDIAGCCLHRRAATGLIPRQ